MFLSLYKINTLTFVRKINTLTYVDLRANKNNIFIDIRLNFFKSYT